MSDRGLWSRFLASEHGNFALITALVVTTIATMVGLAADYSRGSTTRAAMQNSLDAAALAAMTSDGPTTLADRKKTLETIYAGNQGVGVASIVGDIQYEENTAVLNTKAEYSLPTSFMKIIGVNSIDIGVKNKVRSPMRLMQVAFRFKEASGWWDKQVTLMGRKDGSNAYETLAQIHYQWNGKRGDLNNNVGKTTVRLLQNGTLKETYVQDCPDARASSCQVLLNISDNKVDVSEMNSLYLQMDISTPVYQDAIDDINDRNPPVPRIVRTDDPTLSDRLYVEGVQQPKGKKIDIYRVVGCGKVTNHEWEDGGKADERDFAYSVQGFCEPSSRDRGVALAE